MKKLIISMLLACAMLLAGCQQDAAVHQDNQQPDKAPAGNTTSAQNPTTENQSPNGLYEISTADDLYDFAEQYNAGKLPQDIRVVLTCDITVNNTTHWESWAEEGADTASLRKWYPIRYFKGTFDGQGYSISGLYCHLTEADKDTYYYSSLVMSNDGTVCNLTVKDSVFLGDHVSVGPVVGRNKGLVENCHSDVYACASSSIGSISAGNDETGTISNCTAAGKVVTVSIGNSMSVGGICGQNQGIITDCRSAAKIDGDRGSNVGGICGSNLGTVENSFNSGDLQAVNGSVGGIVCDNTQNVTYGIIRNCGNTGSLHTDSEYSSYTSGIACINKGEIVNCWNTGEIFAENSAAGICSLNYRTISYCWNSGEITAVGHAYGLCEGIHRDEAVEISLLGCYNTGNITVIGDPDFTMYNEAAGCFGYSTGIVRNCYNTGNIFAPKEAAGIALDVREGGWADCCYNLGDIQCQGEAYGLVGSVYGKVTYCYNIGDVSGDRDSFALFEGGYAGEIHYCFNAGTVAAHEQHTLFQDRMYECTITVYEKSYMADMTQMSSYYGFDFETVWEMGSSADYPYPTLQNMPEMEN